SILRFQQRRGDDLRARERLGKPLALGAIKRGNQFIPRRYVPVRQAADIVEFFVFRGLRRRRSFVFFFVRGRCPDRLAGWGFLLRASASAAMLGTLRRLARSRLLTRSFPLG